MEPKTSLFIQNSLTLDRDKIQIHLYIAKCERFVTIRLGILGPFSAMNCCKVKITYVYIYISSYLRKAQEKSQKYIPLFANKRILLHSKHVVLSVL